MLIHFCGLFDLRNFLAVDGYIIEKSLERSYRLVYYQVSGEPAIACCNTEAVRVVVDQTFTSGGVDNTRLFVDHLCVNVFIRVSVGLNREVILTVKFSRSTESVCMST